MKTKRLDLNTLALAIVGLLNKLATQKNVKQCQTILVDHIFFTVANA